ncbi:hypothetical protein RJT34_28493 [Clitoria ternatea]|uniref:Uncharacterized protein n=1 Tax=Clitoria ternatea TaxID=43366 RepID=A0AAN9FE46_CLITE
MRLLISHTLLIHKILAEHGFVLLQKVFILVSFKLTKRDTSDFSYTLSLFFSWFKVQTGSAGAVGVVTIIKVPSSFLALPLFLFF